MQFDEQSIAYVRQWRRFHRDRELDATITRLERVLVRINALRESIYRWLGIDAV